MATYTTIPDGNLDPDSPVRSVDGLALRDNPIAIAEAASGAPPVNLRRIVVVDSKSSGTGGGTPTGGAWDTRDLNTVRANNISGASVSSNQISLPAGTYFIYASAPATNVSAHRIRLYDATNTTTLLTGTSENSGAGSAQTRSFVVGTFTLSGTANVEIQHFAASAGSFGSSYAPAGIAEIYTEVTIHQMLEG